MWNTVKCVMHGCQHRHIAGQREYQPSCRQEETCIHTVCECWEVRKQTIAVVCRPVCELTWATSVTRDDSVRWRLHHWKTTSGHDVADTSSYFDLTVDNDGLYAAVIYTHHWHSLLLRLKADTRFSVSWRVDGFVHVCIAVSVCT